MLASFLLPDPVLGLGVELLQLLPLTPLDLVGVVLGFGLGLGLGLPQLTLLAPHGLAGVLGDGLRANTLLQLLRTAPPGLGGNARLQLTPGGVPVGPL